MANKKITDLMSGTPVRDSLLESAIDISGTMDSRKVKVGAVADLASANVAAPYDSTVTYAIGQYCLYEGNIYRCIAITTGAFDSTAWVQIVVTGEFRRVVELTSAQYTALTSAEKNNGTLYIITDEETTAADIPYDTNDSVADKIDELDGKTGSDIPVSDIDPNTTIESAINACWGKTAADISYSQGVSVADKLDTIPSFTPTEVSITKHNFSTNDTQVVRVGNLLICSIAVSNTSTYNSWTDICSITGSFDSNITIMASLSTWDKSRYAQAYMYNTNEIRIRIMGADANASYRGQMIIPIYL